MPDADLEQAVSALMGAAYGAAGERCMAISVAVVVGEETADALVAKLAPLVEALRVGPGVGMTPESEMGPLISREHLAKVRGYVDQGWPRGPAAGRWSWGESWPGLLYRWQPVRSGRPRDAHLPGGDLRPGACHSAGPGL